MKARIESMLLYTRGDYLAKLRSPAARASLPPVIPALETAHLMTVLINHDLEALYSPRDESSERIVLPTL